MLVGHLNSGRLEGVGFYHLKSCVYIYIYRNMYRMSYVPMVFVGKCHVHTDIEKVFFSNHG